MQRNRVKGGGKERERERESERENDRDKAGELLYQLTAFSGLLPMNANS